jgi:hypothetical protein
VNQKEALAFVERHGIVLQAARGPLPNFAEAENILSQWLALGRTERQVVESPEKLSPASGAAPLLK